MTRRITLGLLFCGVACSGHLNDLGTIHASGGATVNVSSAAGGFTPLASGPIGAAASGGVSSTGSNAAGGLTATGGHMTTGGVSSSGGASPSGGASATGGTSGAFVLDLTCKKDTDCCIISNSCGSGFYLVTAAQRIELGARISANPTTMCPACIPPQVVVSCDTVRGICVGEQLSSYDPTSALSKAHCGPVADAGSAGGAKAASSPEVAPASAPDAAVGGGTSTSGTTTPPQTRFGCG